ncbi:hypothetical protein [Bifidobacterium avesanii]|uniref:Uncharacterized protein n=1 Tax=Bifidobacterium avesanii TaxID=1798157 RepID=A0A7K3TFY4_9BIFI|nr:hypothetical protein [Bifidobacterium avesanii]KAB8290630.1 hypothetical protein DSM100685_1423 [Bifidobacterium avesanii]NEG77998.1 hypothetical protein [Bifidobacterium avesanii]
MADNETGGATAEGTVFGPYSFAVDYRGYQRWYASRSLKELRRGFAIFSGFSTVFMLTGLFCFVALHLGMIDASQSVGVNVLFAFCLVQWILALLGLARPRLLLTSQRKLAKAWFEARGVNVAALELAQPDIRQWNVLMRGRLTDLGAEEHLADGYMIRLPYAVLDPEPETIDGILCYRVAADKQGVTLWTLLDKDVHFPAGLVNGTVVVPLEAVGSDAGSDADVAAFKADVARRVAEQRKAIVAESAASVTGSGDPTPTLDAVLDWC